MSDQPQTTVDPDHLRALAVTHADHVHTAHELRRAADEIERLRERLPRTLCRIVDEIIGEIDPPPEYRTAMQVDAWTRGALDAQRAIEKACSPRCGQMWRITG